MVKDLRTNFETSDTKVLDGALDGLVESFLLMHAGEGNPDPKDQLEACFLPHFERI